MTMRVNCLGVLGFAAVLAVSGCAAQEEPESPAVASSAAPSVQQSKDADAAPLDPATCLEGTWLADNSATASIVTPDGTANLTRLK